MTIACEEARSMLYHATLHLEAEPGGRRRAVSAAKTRVGQTGLFVGRQAVQLHGGIGATNELIVSHHLKRLMMIDMAYGNCDHHRALFAACGEDAERS
jgi:alkylation response protein AidB-like acyl-CoA dehydrogenase